MNDDNEQAISKLEHKVEQHDLWLRGDGQITGVMPNVRSLIDSYSRIEAGINTTNKKVEELRETMITGKGWIAGAMFVGGGAGALMLWMLEKFALKHL